MKTSVLLCSLLALVTVSQVAGFNAKVEDATNRIKREAARVLVELSKQLTDRVQTTYDKAAQRITDQRLKSDTTIAAQVKKIQDKGGNYAKCALDEIFDARQRMVAANAAETSCNLRLKTTMNELASAVNDATTVFAKIDFRDCEVMDTDVTPRGKADSLRCVDQRANEWIRLIKEVESSWKRILNSWSSLIVSRGLRCQGRVDKSANDALKTLSAAVVKCDRDTARTTTTKAP